MTDAEVARMIVEGAAAQLSALPERAFDEAVAGGCNQALVRGLRAARDAFYANVSENDLSALKDDIDRDVREGLVALDMERQ